LKGFKVQTTKIWKTISKSPPVQELTLDYHPLTTKKDMAAKRGVRKCLCGEGERCRGLTL